MILAGERVDDLLVAPGAERDGDESLSFASGKQGRTMGPRQHADPDRNRPDGTRVPAVDARLAVEDLAAHDRRFQREGGFLHHVAVGAAFLAHPQRFEDALPDAVDGLRARLLLLDAKSLAQIRLGEFLDPRDERLILLRRLPIPRRLARHLGKLVDRLDGRLHLLVAVHHAAEHHVLRELERLGFDHHDALLGTRDHQIELRGLLKLRRGRVKHVLAVDVADAAGAYGAVERDARKGERRRDREHRGDVGVHLGVQRHHRGDDLHLVVEAVGKQRPDRAVDQARGQGLLLGGPAFALEEAAGNLAGGVGLLDVVDGEREPVLALLGVLGADHGGEHHGVVHGADHRAVGLAGDLAGLEGDVVAAVAEGFLDRVQMLSFTYAARK